MTKREIKNGLLAATGTAIGVTVAVVLLPAKAVFDVCKVIGDIPEMFMESYNKFNDEDRKEEEES